MTKVVGVIVRKIKDKIYADEDSFNLKLNDKVIVETEHGVEVGIVFEKDKNLQKGKDTIGKIFRKVTQEDRKNIADNEERNARAYKTVEQKVIDHELDMKLTCVQYTFDRSKLFIYYTSETRVDFRELIKDLGHILKTKIQMVQIGVRDESKIIGGIGTCGQVLCCQSFLRDFSSVTIDMAKDQELLLNTVKLSGLCGRLMCCIAYENDIYKNIKKDLPELCSVISTPEGKAKLVAIDFIKERVIADFGNKSFKFFSIKQIKDANEKGNK
ncbi:MAG: stage 0 sporulation protein [Endomicrobium sp.]|jgi:cell fate regulator YaaT (PSP1 superfamily)|nr:stage 0 sporulation protein [Endomicrobium sp.]